MLLAVNIGNSNIRFGVKKDEDVFLSWTVNTKPYKTRDELFVIFRNMYEHYACEIKDFTGIVIGSVVPHQTEIIASALQEIHQINPLVVDRNTPSNVIQHSNQMGTDLYANAVAAQSLYKGKKIVVDFGTALTVTGVDEKGEVLGVIIAPGVITSLDALIGNTAQLPDIELKPPKSILGRDTETCMQSGIVYGYIGMVEGFIQRVNQELKDNCTVISTGGLGHIYKSLTSYIHFDDKLHTIKGLCFLYEFLQSNSR